VTLQFFRVFLFLFEQFFTDYHFTEAHFLKSLAHFSKMDGNTKNATPDLKQRCVMGLMWLTMNAYLLQQYIRTHWITQWAMQEVKSIYRFGWRWVRNPLQPNVVIAICGKKGSGKDTSAAKIRRWMWELNGQVYKHRTFAKPLKDTVQLLTNCSNAMLYTHEGKETVFPNPFHADQETYRDILKSVGKATRRFLANWIHQQWKRETELWNTKCKLPNLWVLSDLRLEEELKWVRSLATEGSTSSTNGVRTQRKTKIFIIRVEANGTGTDSDVSEVSVDSFPKNEIDFTIYNKTWNDQQSNLDAQCKNICEAIALQSSE
jgi:hypothetical protein